MLVSSLQRLQIFPASHVYTWLSSQGSSRPRNHSRMLTENVASMWSPKSLFNPSPHLPGSGLPELPPCPYPQHRQIPGTHHCPWKQRPHSSHPTVYSWKVRQTLLSPQTLFQSTTFARSLKQGSVFQGKLRDVVPVRPCKACPLRLWGGLEALCVP